MKHIISLIVSITVFFVALALFAGQFAHADGDVNECKSTVKYVTVYKYVYRDKIVERVVKEDVTRKNRIYLLGGNGPSDTLRVDGLEVSSGDENYLGIGYMRDIGRFNLGVKYQNNEDLGLSLGWSW